MLVNVMAITDHLKVHGQRCSLVSLEWLEECQRCGSACATLRVHELCSDNLDINSQARFSGCASQTACCMPCSIHAEAVTALSKMLVHLRTLLLCKDSAASHTL